MITDISREKNEIKSVDRRALGGFSSGNFDFVVSPSRNYLKHALMGRRRSRDPASVIRGDVCR